MDNSKSLRVACCMGEFSVWQEGAHERELFRMNLGVLAEIARRADRQIQTARRSLPELRELSEGEIAKIWRRCTSDPEVRFCASLRIGAASLGGWRRCLDLAGKFLRMQGKPVPWESTQFVGCECGG